MQRTPFSIRPAILLGSVLALACVSAPAHAQFPVFYGGEVLTPFGNRGSDGSYRYPYQNPRRYAAQPRSYATTPASRYYFVPQGTYYVQQPRTYTYAPRRGPFRRFR